VIEITKPFAAYVLTHEFPRTGDARKFEFGLPFRIEGTKDLNYRRWPWSYSGTQEAIDAIDGLDGLKTRREEQMAAFQRWLEKELKVTGDKLYAVQGEELLVRGTA
jgi:hypothetical protein